MHQHKEIRHMICSMDQNRTNFGSALNPSAYLNQKQKGGSIYGMCASPMIQNFNSNSFSILKNHTTTNMINRNYCSDMGNSHNQLPMAMLLAPDVSHEKHLTEDNNAAWECQNDVIGNSFTKLIRTLVTTMLKPIIGIMDLWKTNEVDNSLETFSDIDMDFTFDEDKQKLLIEPSTTKLRDRSTPEKMQFSTTTNSNKLQFDNNTVASEKLKENMSLSGENLKTPEENVNNKVPLLSNNNTLNQPQSQLIENNRNKLDKRRNKRKNRKTKNKLLETVNNNNNRTNVKQCISTSSFNPCNFFHKSRIMNKNKKEKVRQEIEWNIHDDIDVDETDFVITPGISGSNNNSNNNINLIQSVNKVNDDIYSPVSGCLSKNFSDLVSCSPKFTYNDFPSMPAPKKTQTNNCNNSKSDLNIKDCDYQPTTNNLMYQYKEDEENEDVSMFYCIPDEPEKKSIEFVEHKAQIPITKSYDIVPSQCILKNIPRRIRQISECSDDSYICFEADDTLSGDRGCTWSDVEDHDDDDEDDDEDDDDGDIITQIDLDSNIVESDDEEDLTTTDTEIESVGTNQPDSGFEEKTFKVRFNLNHKVHVMRTWNYAYRQARIGIWEQIGRDRVRFHDKIKTLELDINRVLTPTHRAKIFSERFSIIEEN